jgi:PAS domain-containing protein
VKDTGDTQFVMPLSWHDPRVHLLDDTWLLTIFAVLFATAVPWLVSGLSIELLATTAGLLAIGALHVAFAALVGRHSTNPRGRKRVLMTLHALGVLALAFIWAHAGGLQNPLFLTVFALPVIGSIFLSRWQPYGMALLATLLVALVAWTEAPELRWYAPALGHAAPWLDRILGGSAGAGLPFTGFYAPSEYYVVLLEVFAITLFACAIAAEYLGTVFERLHAQVGGARAEAERGQELWSSLIDQLPLPAFLLDADSAQVISASDVAAAQFGGAETEIVGRSLFETLSFSYPEVIQELVSGPGGVAKLCMLHHAGRLVATEVAVRHLALKGRRMALVVVTETTAAFCIQAALDASEYAVLVVDAAGRVLAFNKPAAALFPDAQLDASLATLLPQPDAARWWDPGLGARRKTHVSIMQRVYQLTSSTVLLPGEDERLYIVAFMPVARTAAVEQSSTDLGPRVQQQ